MKDRNLAARYARALLAALPDDRAAEAADTFLSALAESYEASSELRDVFLNPAVRREQRKKVLAELTEGRGVGREVRNFLFTVADHGRLAVLPTIAVMFREARERHIGVVPAVVTTAAGMAPDLVQRLSESLDRLSGRAVRLEMKVDPAVLGGVISQVGSTIYDGSVRTQLSRLRHRMAEE
jgi:F-type H+-transporting ATPase subunit delta